MHIIYIFYNYMSYAAFFFGLVYLKCSLPQVWNNLKFRLYAVYSDVLVVEDISHPKYYIFYFTT